MWEVRLRHGDSATIRAATPDERRLHGLAEGGLGLVIVVTRPGQEDETVPALGTTIVRGPGSFSGRAEEAAAD